MAKNVNNNIITRIKRKFNEPYIPHLVDSKLEHAMLELKNARNEVLKAKKRLYLSIFINFILILLLIYGINI
jgi:hypothetical protein